MIGNLTIGQLAARTGLSVRTLRFYADSGVLPEAGRSESGYRLFGADAVARARLVRTMRELGVGLDAVKRALNAEASLVEIAAAHANAIDAQIRTLRLPRAVLRAVARSTEAKELELMTDLTTLTAEEHRRILDDYLDAVFGDEHNEVADKMRTGAPELPDDPTPDQVVAWIELAQLLRDPDFVATSKRMAQRAMGERPTPDPAQLDLRKAVGEHAGAAARAGVAPDSAEALAVIERLEAITPGNSEDRNAAAERIEAFNDRRVGRYWALVAIVNGWRRIRRRTPTRCMTPGSGTHARSAHTRRPRPGVRALRVCHEFSGGTRAVPKGGRRAAEPLSGRGRSPDLFCSSIRDSCSLTSANIELARAIFASRERGDWISAGWAHPEIELVLADGPSPETWMGTAGMARGWRDFLSVWEGYRVEAQEYRELDDECVLVFARRSGHGNTSGVKHRADRGERSRVAPHSRRHCHEARRLVLSRERAR